MSTASSMEERKLSEEERREAARVSAAKAEANRSFMEGYMQKSDPTGKRWKRRYVVVDEARQEMTYFGSDPKRTLVELHLTEYPKGSISLKHAHIEIGGTVPKNAPTKFIFKLVTADRSSYFCVQSLEKLAAWKVFIEQAVLTTASKVAKRRWALLARERAKVRASMTAKPFPHASWILKTDPEGRAWTQRWLVLDIKSYTLTYFDDDNVRKNPKGVINLRGATVDIGSNNPALRNIPAFSLVTLGRTYQFCADSDANFRLWVNNLSATLRQCKEDANKRMLSSDMKRPYAGFLRKSDPRGKHWKKRWVVLDPIKKMVSYFTKEDKKTKKGEFSMRGATVVVGTSKIKPATQYCIVITTPDRTWYLCAQDQEDMAGWLDRFEFVIRKAAPVAKVGHVGTKFGNLAARVSLNAAAMKNAAAAATAAARGGAGAGAGRGSGSGSSGGQLGSVAE